MFCRLIVEKLGFCFLGLGLMFIVVLLGGNDVGLYKLWYIKDEGVERFFWFVFCVWVECCLDCILVVRDGDEVVFELGDW